MLKFGRHGERRQMSVNRLLKKGHCKSSIRGSPGSEKVTLKAKAQHVGQ